MNQSCLVVRTRITLRSLDVATFLAAVVTKHFEFNEDPIEANSLAYAGDAWHQLSQSPRMLELMMDLGEEKLQAGIRLVLVDDLQKEMLDVLCAALDDGDVSGIQMPAHITKAVVAWAREHLDDQVLSLYTDEEVQQKREARHRTAMLEHRAIDVLEAKGWTMRNGALVPPRGWGGNLRAEARAPKLPAPAKKHKTKGKDKKRRPGAPVAPPDKSLD